jgi:hypothetical protein
MVALKQSVSPNQVLVNVSFEKSTQTAETNLNRSKIGSGVQVTNSPLSIPNILI